MLYTYMVILMKFIYFMMMEKSYKKCFPSNPENLSPSAKSSESSYQQIIKKKIKKKKKKKKPKKKNKQGNKLKIIARLNGENSMTASLQEREKVGNETMKIL